MKRAEYSPKKNRMKIAIRMLSWTGTPGNWYLTMNFRETQEIYAKHVMTC